MVRFKNRYLLFEIIYADTPLGWTSIPASTASATEAANQSMGPGHGVFGDTGRNNCRLPPISSKDLINIFRTSIGDNFGDYGAGITQRGLVCTIKQCQLTTIRYDRDRIMFLRNQAQLLNDSQTYTQLGLAFKDSADEVNALEV
ncbi:hypothetical protein EC968_004685 [Mortierella alpina]|nr:hypothetical protein EC968_004685 [Mortierella alpina]